MQRISQNETSWVWKWLDSV